MKHWMNYQILALGALLFLMGCRTRRTDASSIPVRERAATVAAKLDTFNAGLNAAVTAGERFQSTMETMAKEATKEEERMEKNYVASSERLPEGARANSDGLYRMLKGRRAPVEQELNASLARLKELGALLSVERCSALQRQMVEEERTAYRARHKGRDPNHTEMKQIMERAGLRYIQKQRDLLVEYTMTNERVRLLWKRRSSILFEYHVYDEMNRLNHYFLQLNARTLFETGYWELTLPQEDLLEGSVREMVDSLVTRLNVRYNRLQPEAIAGLHIGLRADGFADTQRIPGLSIEAAKESNLLLSQNRADEILRIVGSHLRQGLETLNRVGLFVTTEQQAHGYGERMPGDARQYAPDGQDDPTRRMVDVYITISVIRNGALTLLGPTVIPGEE